MVSISLKHIAKANHTFREKLKLVAAIPEMIKQGKYSSYTPVHKDKGVNIEGYYVLTVDVMVGNNLKGARVVLEENNEGKVLYDIGIKKKEALAALGDTIENETFNDLSGSSHYQDFLNESYQDLDSEVNQFDKMTTSELILNIFFDDADSNSDLYEAQSNEIKDESATSLPIEAESPIVTVEPTKGNVNNSTTVKGTKIKSVFALVECDSLITSHTATGAKKPDFPQELQPRDRSDEKSVESIKENSKNLNPEKLGATSFVGNGAPIVGSDLIVESGNGRTIAIKTAYNNGDAGEYKIWLIENASKFGFTAEQVEGYQQPVLVRIRETEVNRIDFAIEANLDAYPKYFNQDTDTTTANEVPVNTTDNNNQASTSTAIERLDAMQALAEDDSIEPSEDFLDELMQIEGANTGDDMVAQKIEIVGKAYEKKLAKIAIKAMQDMVSQ